MPFVGGDHTIGLPLPTGWFTLAMMVGAAACTLAFVVDAWRHGPWGLARGGRGRRPAL